MTLRLVQELTALDVLVAATCRVLRVSSSGYYEWRGRAPSLRAVADQTLSAQIVQVHHESRGSYGVPHVHAELRPGPWRALRPQARSATDAVGRSPGNLQVARHVSVSGTACAR